ncbi:MAG: MFS transporter [Hyphomicrobiales bacterium]|jgi:MFS transporter, PAT family, beta-lactamase induction signal transducer AmpG|nr:MFS transporter [Hyphomicrobiales bacterium]MBV8420410.1 MFS transporter [Hyphomicrobiales bacterium]
MTVAPDTTVARANFTDALAVYLKPRVLIILLLGFSGGLPLILTGGTLQAWMSESGVDLRTIGLFAAVGFPYTLKFLWAPFIDALDIPVLSSLLGRRRGWLLLSQLVLMAAIVLLAFCDPALSPWIIAAAALLVSTASATQDIVIDAFRVESLPEEEQAAGMASYVAAYRVGALVSGAGALFLVTGFLALGLPQQAAWTACYVAMALLILVGVTATLFAVEPEKSVAAAAEHASHAQEDPLKRTFDAAIASLYDFLSRDMAFVMLAFVVTFKLADALAFSLATPFILDIGFSRTELATIMKGVGFAATLLGGFAGGFIARAYPLTVSLWIGAILQTVTILAFSLQAVIGKDLAMLTFAITVASFTGAIGTVVFVAYQSALCSNPLHTATQFALLTALDSLGRTVFSLGSGYMAAATGWAFFFVICAMAGVPSFFLLVWLQRRGHFTGLAKPTRIVMDD